MGRDKALLLLARRPAARRVADAAREAGAASVVALGGDGPALAELGLATRQDEHPGEGPLPALAAELRGADHDVVLVLGCDLVAPSSRAMAATVQALFDDPRADVAVPVDADGHRQWVHAAWRTRAASALAAAVVGGERSMAGAAPPPALLEVPGLDPESLRDADRPEDLPGAG